MATASKTPKTAGPATKGLKVTARRDGFRRAGREWNGTEMVPLDKLTPEQAELLKAETTMLIVEEVDIEPAKG
jgi:hypothetical protein